MKILSAIRDWFKPDPWEAEFEALMKMQPGDDGKDHRAISDALVELGNKSFMIPQSEWTRRERAYWYMYRRFAARWAYRLALLNQMKREKPDLPAKN